ncbi:MAG: hypothetical protein ABSH56_19540 [Bryobacteraceae bacterium]|jgi:hypothetical protein
MPQEASPDDSLLRRWVQTWRRAGEELERLRRAEIESVDTREAVRQIFGGDAIDAGDLSPTSGLVQQQAWFARIYHSRREA